MWWKYRPQGLSFAGWVAIDDYLTDEEVQEELDRLDEVADRMTTEELLRAGLWIGDFLKTLKGTPREKALLQLRGMAAIKIWDFLYVDSGPRGKDSNQKDEIDMDLIREFSGVEFSHR